MPNEVKLLPCPFCGSEGELFERYRGLWNVHCLNGDCGVTIDPAQRNHAACAEVWNHRPTTVVTDEVVEPSGLPQHQQPLSDIPDMVERVARAMAQASGRDPDGITAPTRGQLGSRKLWELYVPQAKAALEASHHAELVEELAEVAEVAKACAKREHQYFADRKELLLALKRSRIALNLVPANDKRFNPSNHAKIKIVTDIIDEALAKIKGDDAPPRHEPVSGSPSPGKARFKIGGCDQ